MHIEFSLQFEVTTFVRVCSRTRAAPPPPAASRVQRLPAPADGGRRGPRERRVGLGRGGAQLRRRRRGRTASLRGRGGALLAGAATRYVYRISLMSRIIDREKFLDNCIHTFLSVHSDIQQPYTCTIYTRVLVYRYRFEHALLLRTRAQASRCCGLHRCPSSCLSLHSSSKARVHASLKHERNANAPQAKKTTARPSSARHSPVAAGAQLDPHFRSHIFSFSYRRLSGQGTDCLAVRDGGLGCCPSRSVPRR